MEPLGVWLRQTREARENTLREAEKATRIRTRFLKMLEAGDFAAFPGGEVQVRGFLRIYADYLGLPPDKVLSRYEAEVHGIGAAVPATTSTETQTAPPSHSTAGTTAFQPPSTPISTSRPHRTSLETLVIAVVVLAALVAIVVGVRFFLNRNADEQAAATVTATAPTEALPSAPTETSNLSTSPLTTPTNLETGVTLTLGATEHVWVRVATDDLTAFQGLLSPGQVETWSGQEIITVETGNGAGLLVTVNDQPQGVMCGRAEACTRAWGVGGEIAVP